MKKRELIDAVMNKNEEIPSRDDPRVTSIMADIQLLLNSGNQVVLPGFASLSVAHRPPASEEERQRLENERRRRIGITTTLGELLDVRTGFFSMHTPVASRACFFHDSDSTKEQNSNIGSAPGIKK